VSGSFHNRKSAQASHIWKTDPQTRARVREHEHIRGLDAFPAADGRAVKTQPVGKDVFRQLIRRNGKVLPGAMNITELEITI